MDCRDAGVSLGWWAAGMLGLAWVGGLQGCWGKPGLVGCGDAGISLGWWTAGMLGLAWVGGLRGCWG